MWIDTHCHLDAPEFAGDVAAVRARARAAGVAHCVLPAVRAADFERVRALAHEFGDSYALGIHPLYVAQADDGDLVRLDAALTQYRDDPHLVAVGEIGLDYFVPELCEPPLRERQAYFYVEQLKLARQHGLPVILHVRRSADQLLKGLRAVGSGQPWQGIAHAFNGSAQQAHAFIQQGLKLGFGGALTYERAQNLRRLATELPLESIVLETDAPDMPPHWLYKTAEERANGTMQGRNEPGELPRIAQVLAMLRGMDMQTLAQATSDNARAALPRLQALPALSRMNPSPRLHGLPPIVGPGTRLLILGSFPGVASLQARQYYAHPRNQFWTILQALWPDVPMDADYARRCQWLLARGLGLWDVYASCERAGSLDSAIRHAQVNDFAALKAQCPHLRLIAHNGGESFKHAKLVRASLLSDAGPPQVGKAPSGGSTAHEVASVGAPCQHFPLVKLPSTSPANASWSFERKLAAWHNVMAQAGLL